MEKFIHINLNQTINRAQLMEIRRERWRWVGFVVVILVFITLGYAIYSINTEMDDLIENRETRIEDVISQIEALKEKAEVDLSKRDVESLFKMEKSRIVWAKIFTILAEVTPEDMAITEMYFTDSHGNGSLVISGISHTFNEEKEFSIIDDFVTLLESNEYFSKSFTYIRFLSSDRHLTRGQEISQFKVEAREFKPVKRKSRAELNAELEMEAK